MGNGRANAKDCSKGSIQFDVLWTNFILVSEFNVTTNDDQ
jgi:hypothetical protein